MMDRINTFLVASFARLQREEGQATLEYALVLVAIAGIVAAGIFTGVFGNVQTKLDGLLK